MKLLKPEDTKWKGLDWYTSLKTKWNKDAYGIPWRDKYSSKPSVGAMVHLCNKWNPSSYEEFYRMYIEDGERTKDKSMDKKFRGRTLEELENIAIKWQNDCGDFVTPLSEFFDAIILHTIVETYVGKDFEDKAKKCLYEHGYDIKHANDEEDSALNIDFKVFKDDKLLCFIQVKPLSFITSNKYHTLKDRLNAFDKHDKGHTKYPGIPYYYLVYDVFKNKWAFNPDKHRCLFTYDELVKRNGEPVRSKYMMRKSLTDDLFRAN